MWSLSTPHYNSKIPKGRDGNFKAPKWDHLVAAAEMEMVRIEEGYVEENNWAWELASLKHRLEVTSTGTCKYPQPSNQLEFPEGTITDNTEPDIDCAEPPMDCVDAIMDVMEPMVEIEETDLKNYSQESVLETAASTIQLLDMATNQKPSTAYFMDKEMELKHTVIEISDFGLDSVDSTISVDMTTSMDEEEILDQSIQQNQTVDHQTPQINNHDSQIEHSILTETTVQDPQFSHFPAIALIEDINKPGSKIFNKHLFKPHLDQQEEIFNKLSLQAPGPTDADPGEIEGKNI
ncbi:hypothetical protein PTTG_30591, partial [Puccinia triticina 1-1 BBBD Race 1]